MGLVRSVRTLSADQKFRAARRAHLVLARFGDPESLVALFADAAADADAKDTLYRVLVQDVQAGSDWADLAISLIWLGLWPGLDHVYRRHLRPFIHAPEGLVAEMGWRLTALIGRVDLDETNHMVGRLVDGVFLEIRDAVRAERARTARHEPLPVDDCLQESEEDRPDLRAGGPHFREPDDPWVLDRVRSRLSRVDQRVVLGHAVVGLTHLELARILGLSHENVRKRNQRAMRILRDQLVSNRTDVPLCPAGPPFSGEGRSPSGGESR